MIKGLAKIAVSYAVAGAAMQCGANLYANRKLVKVKVKKIINAAKN